MDTYNTIHIGHDEADENRICLLTVINDDNLRLDIGNYNQKRVFDDDDIGEFVANYRSGYGTVDDPFEPEQIQSLWAQVFKTKPKELEISSSGTLSFEGASFLPSDGVLVIKTWDSDETGELTYIITLYDLEPDSTLEFSPDDLPKKVPLDGSPLPWSLPELYEILSG